MSLEVTSMRSKLPLTRWLLLYCPLPFDFHLLLYCPPSLKCLGAMVYPLFNPKVDFLLYDYHSWPKVRRIWKINYVRTLFLPFFLSDMLWKSWLKADLCQISCRRCRKSLLAHVIIMYNLPAAVFNGSCFSYCPTFLAPFLPPNISLPENVDFSPFWKK